MPPSTPAAPRGLDARRRCGGRRGTARQPRRPLPRGGTCRGRELTATGRSTGTPRSVAFNVQAFRIAVNKHTGAIEILRSVHAADAGRVINPMQCRGQIEGGVAQSLGAALYEEMVIDDGGRVINPTFRNYHIPAFGDVPRTEVLVCRHLGFDRSVRRQVDEREPLQSDRRRAWETRWPTRPESDFARLRSSPIVFSRRSWKNSARLERQRVTNDPLQPLDHETLSAPRLRRGATRPHPRQPSVRRNPRERGGRGPDRDGKRISCRIAT